MDASPARVLTEAEWPVLRAVRLEALRDSPDSFVASHDEEAQHDEAFWRDRLQQNRWLIAEADGEVAAVVGLGTHGQDPDDGEIFGLWVSPERRRSRLGWDLVRAAVDQAVLDGRRHLYFWVGSSNGPAVAFASVVGFRPSTQRRPARAAPGEEIAMVMTLASDPSSVANPRFS